MTRPLQLRRLHFLNALFAPLTGHDLYLAQQIDDAISTSLGEAEERAPSDPALFRPLPSYFNGFAQPSRHMDSFTGMPALTTPALPRSSLVRASCRA